MRTPKHGREPHGQVLALLGKPKQVVAHSDGNTDLQCVAVGMSVGKLDTRVDLSLPLTCTHTHTHTHIRTNSKS